MHFRATILTLEQILKLINPGLAPETVSLLLTRKLPD
jgi:hypothetical protein